MIAIDRRAFLELAVLAGTAGLVSHAMASQEQEQEQEHRVVISQFDYSPKQLKARYGDTITWFNEDIVPHTATANDQSWDTGEIKPGESISISVDNTFNTDYFCAYHPMMKASIRLKN